MKYVGALLEHLRVFIIGKDSARFIVILIVPRLRRGRNARGHCDGGHDDRRSGCGGGNRHAGAVVSRDYFHLSARRAKLNLQAPGFCLISFSPYADIFLRNRVVYYIGRAAGPSGYFRRNRGSRLWIFTFFNQNFISHIFTHRHILPPSV
jgi:hypothetical protein